MEYLNSTVLDNLYRDQLSAGGQKNAAIFERFLTDLGKSFEFKIFSTNYDNLIRHINSEADYYLVKKAGTLKNVIDTNKLVKEGGPYTYIPIKGMLDWRKEGDRWVEGNRRTNPLSESVIMFLENASVPNEEPHISLYQEFEKELVAADSLLFIGFSFHDAPIQQLIQDCPNINEKKKIIIVSKSDSPEDVKEFRNHLKVVFAPNSKWIHIPHGFNGKMQEKILEYLCQ